MFTNRVSDKYKHHYHHIVILNLTVAMLFFLVKHTSILLNTYTAGLSIIDSVLQVVVHPGC